ncbi:hypothetical protein LTR97_011056 [Elasticomyces elasticus]|uniref:Uncharacterized protein n=1 Tax=Elasticomyces elasticus TaxID=574655 RepID=A0AAN7W162_9PEZI|nr:hypothetical protein LTR97_011056 [Elasticomyces elasticus]
MEATQARRPSPLLLGGSLAVISTIGVDIDDRLSVASTKLRNKVQRRQRFCAFWFVITDRCRAVSREVFTRAGKDEDEIVQLLQGSVDLVDPPENASTAWHVQGLPEALQRVFGTRHSEFSTNSQRLLERLYALADLLGTDVSVVKASLPQLAEVAPQEGFFRPVLSKERRIENSLKYAIAQINKIDRLMPMEPGVVVRPAIEQEQYPDESPVQIRWEEVQPLVEAAHHAFHLTDGLCQCDEPKHMVHVRLQRRIRPQYSSAISMSEQERLRLAISREGVWKNADLRRISNTTSYEVYPLPERRCSRIQALSELQVLHLGLHKDTGSGAVSLHEIGLADSTDQVDPSKENIRTANLRTRRALPVLLALSVLQLGTTPWLGRLWTDEDLLFRNFNSPEELQPHIAPPLPDDLGMRGFGTTQMLSHNAAILALGIFVAQMGCDPNGHLDLKTDATSGGTSLKSRWANDGKTGIGPLLGAAIKSSRNDISERCYAVVDQCIRLYNEPLLNLKDEAQVKEVWQWVVLPLLEEENRLGEALV